MEYDWTKTYAPYVDPDDEESEKKESFEDNAVAKNMACSHDHSSERAIYDLPLEEKISRMQKFMHRGNDFFEEGQYDRAYLQYRSLLTYYEYTFPEDDAGWKVIDDLRFTCNLNAAAAALKLPGMHQEVLQNCFEALQKDPDNVKALYRRSQVLRALDRFDEANADLKRALAVRPHDAQLREEAGLLRSQVLAYKQHRKAMAERMMGQHAGWAGPETHKAETPPQGPKAAAHPAASSVSSVNSTSSRRRLLGAAPVLGDATIGSKTIVDDLDEPISFDFEAVSSIIVGLSSEPPQRHRLLISPDSVSPSEPQMSDPPIPGHKPEQEKRSQWVFGDLNRPGAFVRQRRRQNAPTGTEGPGASCQCCLPFDQPVASS